MSTERSLDWTTANVVGRELTVSLDETPDAGWLDIAQRVINQRESEVRGQTWERLSTSSHGLCVGGLDPDASTHDLQIYLTELVAAINRQVLRERKRQAGAQASDEQAERDAGRRDEDLTQRFRNPPSSGGPG